MSRPYISDQLAHVPVVFQHKHIDVFQHIAGVLVSHFLDTPQAASLGLRVDGVSHCPDRLQEGVDLHTKGVALLGEFVGRTENLTGDFTGLARRLIYFDDIIADLLSAGSRPLDVARNFTR